MKSCAYGTLSRSGKTVVCTADLRKIGLFPKETKPHNGYAVPPFRCEWCELRIDPEKAA